MPFKDYRTESKSRWGMDIPADKQLDRDQLVLGAILRIADATEAMAVNNVRLQSELAQYKRWYENGREENKTLLRRIAALQGVINRMKKFNK